VEAQSTILNWIVFIPTIAAIVVLIAPRSIAKHLAVGATLLTFVLSLTLFSQMGWWVEDAEGQSVAAGAQYGDLHYAYSADWITYPVNDEGGEFKIQYFVGLDGLSFPLVILTTFVSFLSCMASWRFDTWAINKGPRGYFALFLLLETGMLGVFVSLDFFLFYVFWEVMLLPMYFLIGVWGGKRKEYAAIKFFLYTLAGSVLMLIALLGFYFYSADVLPNGSGTFNLITLATDGAIQDYFRNPETKFLGWGFATAMFVMLGIGFAVKVPVVPLHTWLPDAHVEAPTPISMILAGVLLKMGAYGFLRISYPILPTAAAHFAYAIAMIGVVSILYGALCAMAQSDFKKLVAYSSVSHMGYVMLGLAVMTPAGFQGAMFQVIAHGISSPMCFFLVGVIYDRAHHREINRFGGLWLSMPVYGSLATLGFFASLGLPGMCGFIGEIWVLLGAFGAAEYHQLHGTALAGQMAWAKPVTVAAAFGVVLTAGYILWMIQRVYLGKEREEYRGFPEATGREIFILTPFAILAIALGVLPKQTLFDFMNGTLDSMLQMMNGQAETVAAVAQAVLN
jgi:NADH-quinone oxidoreductase subunit M